MNSVKYGEICRLIRRINNLIDERRKLDFQSFDYEDITNSIRDTENELFGLQGVYGFKARLNRTGHYIFEII
jgi:hypothetical protein